MVIVGAGQAGAALAARLRARGHQGPLTLFGAEPVAPYQRPPLSKAYMTGAAGIDRLFLRAPDFYGSAGIELRTGSSVISIDRAGRTVTGSDGSVTPYDMLALTTGAIARKLPAAMGGDLAGVHVLRSLADADALRAEMVPGRRVLIVGGGYIGLEAAAVAAKLGLEVTLVEAAARILGRVACAETADWFRALHLSRGVRIIEGKGLARIAGAGGRVTGAELADGTRIAADFAIIGIGVEPDTALAATAGLALDNGIATDAFARTSDSAIWAAGDCASFPHDGRRIRLESVQNAIDQAEVAADAMLGEGRPYAPVPWFWSDQYEAKLQIAGLNTGYDRVVVRAGDGAGRSHWYYHAQRLLSVDAMDDSRAYMVGKRLIEAGATPDPDRIADPAVDLRSLLPGRTSG